MRARLLATGDARIVNVASGAHRRGHLRFDDLQREKSYRPFEVYGTTKLCNVLFTRELALQLAGTGVSANCLHPGFVATRFGDEAGPLYSIGVRIAKLFAISQEEGAKTTVYLASSPDVAQLTGGYFDECALANPSRAAENAEDARRLWEISERLAG